MAYKIHKKRFLEPFLGTFSSDRQIADATSEMNKRVYALYGLDADDVKRIEEATATSAGMQSRHSRPTGPRRRDFIPAFPSDAATAPGFHPGLRLLRTRRGTHAAVPSAAGSLARRAVARALASPGAVGAETHRAMSSILVLFQDDLVRT